MLIIRSVHFLPDGRSVVDTIGGKRFQVLSRGMKDGYSTADIEYLQDSRVRFSRMSSFKVKKMTVGLTDTFLSGGGHKWTGKAAGAARCSVRTGPSLVPEPEDPLPQPDPAALWTNARARSRHPGTFLKKNNFSSTFNSRINQYMALIALVCVVSHITLINDPLKMKENVLVFLKPKSQFLA